MDLYFKDVLPYVDLMLKGLGISIYVTVVGMVFGCFIGIYLYIAKTGKSKILRILSNAYIEVFRNTPLLVKLYLLYFGVSQIGIDISPLMAVLIGMSLNNGAYVAEIFRAGFNAVSTGLKEAGSALGLSSFQIFKNVLLPPAIKNVFPALTNQFVLLFLASSVASVISLGELTHTVLYIESKTFRTFEVLTIAAILYYGCSSIFAAIAKRMEKKLFRY